MSEQRQSLSRRSTEVLRLISQGRTYEQILSIHPEMTYLDIFHAAQEALEATAPVAGGYSERSARMREDTSGSYEKWSPSEDAELARLVAMGESVEAIASRLGRQTSAIRSRMMKLNFSGEDVSG